ncbi:MAG: TIGR03621 family F420-dependent LLM class oxidoreductase [Acidimicrobiales bacterium]
MPHDRRFRFGVHTGGQQAATPDAWAALARRAEELDYDSLFLPDHFGDQLAPVPAMMAAAAATTDLKVGALVFGVDYRHPVVLAREIATIDALSGGRVEVGLGAGWLTSDYDGAGITMDPPGVRIERMAEALAVCRGLWGDEPLTFDGRYYTIKGLDGRPKPVQRPHPPVLIGGGGRRVLSLAAREAEIVGINPNLRSGAVGSDTIAEIVAERVDEKVAWVRHAAGDRLADLELNLLVQVAMVVDDRQSLIESTAPAFGLTPQQVLDSPYVWVGTVEQISGEVEGWRDRWGISYWIVHADVMEPVAPVVARLAGH